MDENFSAKFSRQLKCRVCRDHFFFFYKQCREGRIFNLQGIANHCNTSWSCTDFIINFLTRSMTQLPGNVTVHLMPVMVMYVGQQAPRMLGLPSFSPSSHCILQRVCTLSVALLPTHWPKILLVNTQNCLLHS